MLDVERDSLKANLNASFLSHGFCFFLFQYRHEGRENPLKCKSSGILLSCGSIWVLNVERDSLKANSNSLFLAHFVVDFFFQCKRIRKREIPLKAKFRVFPFPVTSFWCLTCKDRSGHQTPMLFFSLLWLLLFFRQQTRKERKPTEIPAQWCLFVWVFISELDMQRKLLSGSLGTFLLVFLFFFLLQYSQKRGN